MKTTLRKEVKKYEDNNPRMYTQEYINTFKSIKKRRSLIIHNWCYMDDEKQGYFDFDVNNYWGMITDDNPFELVWDEKDIIYIEKEEIEKKVDELFGY